MVVTKWQFIALIGFFGMGSLAFGQQRFGYDGRDGNSGQSGYDGRSGETVEFYADGARASYNLAGEEGREGSDGYDGSAASSCSHGTPAYNLIGATGGDGGRGGAGGDGGDGGAVTVYYDALASLREVFLDTSPGRGAYGGYGGRGGEGCFCQRGSWDVGEGDDRRTYYCTNGARGVQGNQGSRGSEGSYGMVKVIGQADRLDPNVTRKELPISEIGTGPFPLGVNRWSQQRGARNLFAIGSRISDSYWRFDGRRTVEYGFTWNVERPVTDFEGVTLYLTMNSDFSVTWSHTSGFWHAGEEVETDSGVNYVFTAVATSEEAMSTSLGAISGSGAMLAAAIEDGSGATEIFENKVYLNYYTRNGRSYYRRFAGYVPESALEVVGGQVNVKLGESGINESYLTAGTYTYIDLTITRSLGNHEGSKRFTKYHQISD